MNTPALFWDEAATDILKRMHNEGFTAGEISKSLTDQGYPYSRNAVIGRKNRLRLPPPPSDSPQAQLKAQRKILDGKISFRRPKVIFHRKPHPLGAQAAEIEMLMKPPGSNAVPLLESRDGQCKAIIRYEDGELAKAIYCGDPTSIKYVKGRISHNSWCKYHHEAYTQADRPGTRPIYRGHR